MTQRGLSIDRTVLELLAEHGFQLHRVGHHAIFKNAKGQILSVSRTPRNHTLQYKEVLRDIRRLEAGLYTYRGDGK